MQVEKTPENLVIGDSEKVCNGKDSQFKKMRISTPIINKSWQRQAKQN